MGKVSHYLKQELLARRKRNPRYSLRAFAAFLGISYSFLAKLLRDKNLPSEPMLEEMCERLRLDHTTVRRLKESLAFDRKKMRQK